MRIIFTGLNLFFIAAISFASVNIAYSLLFPSIPANFSSLGHEAGSGVVTNGQKQNDSGKSPSISNYNSIAGKNIFGILKEDSTEPSPSINLENLKETKLNLKLLGTVVGFSSNFAVILADNKQGLYREGDSIKDALIKKIFRQKLVLTRNGEDEILEIEFKGGQKSRISSASNSGDIGELGENEFRISRKFIEKSMQNLNGLLRQARARPYFENGKPSGLKIDSIRPYSIFSKMGLKNGDVLVGANGNEIKTVNDAIGLYNSLQSSNRVSIAIKRNGAEETLQYNIQ